MTNGKTYFCFLECKIKLKVKSGIVFMLWGNQSLSLYFDKSKWKTIEHGFFQKHLC